jgi:E3 ubiquitin-protein ligase MYCBP2
MNGEFADDAACECYRLNRCTCPKDSCHKTFCVSCHAFPFHEGWTCEQHRLIEEGIVCRFCDSPVIGGDKLSPAVRVCTSEECRNALSDACDFVCECGHACCGIRGETVHFGCGNCNHQQCSACNESCALKPSIMLACHHEIHLSCVPKLFEEGSKVGKIKLPQCKKFGCRALPSHESVAALVNVWQPICREIEELLVEVVRIEGFDHEEAHVKNPECQEYFGKPLEYARDVCVFFMCSKCQHPFFAGRVECGGDDEPLPDAPVCARCARASGNIQSCPKHGDQAMQFKCFYCCRAALWFCFGTTHFCDPCHRRWREAKSGPWPECDGKCFFHPHPPNGTEQIFGVCSMC